MKRFLWFGLTVAVGVLAGCGHAPPHHRPAKPSPSYAGEIVTPDGSLAGKVVAYDAVGRFVVINFPAGRLPPLQSRLFVYRAGLRIGELRVTGPQTDWNTVADLVSGEVQSADTVRDR